MFSVFITHIIDLFIQKKKESKSFFQMIFDKNGLMFNKKDWLEFKGSMKWFLGFGDRPLYGRWTYWEKFDYFAVFGEYLLLVQRG